MPTVFNHRLVVAARTDLGLTQEDAAAAAGVDVRTWRRYESGEVNLPGEGFSVRHPSRRRILQRIARELGIAEDDLLVEQAAPAPAPPAGFRVHASHVLPRPLHFVGREAELSLLRDWFAGAHAGRRVIAVVALGGAGKTSLVERFLADVGDGPHPGGVFVWSFYDDPRVEAFLDRALGYLAQGSTGAAPGERLEALADALGEAPHLFVLDGLEIAQGDGRGESTLGRVEDALLRRFLMRAARGLGKARVLLTTRLAIADLAAWEGDGLHTLRLGALSEAEGLALLGRWGVAGGAGELAPLVDRVGGHALSVAVMGSYAGAFLGGDPRRARAIALGAAARDDPAARRLHALLSAYARDLAPAERDLVARLSLFPAGVDVEVLAAVARAGGAVAGAIAGLDAAALTALCARLDRLGLVSAQGKGRFTTHPFLAEHFQSLLGAPAEEIHAATRATFAARLDTHGSGPTESARLDAYEALLLSTLRAGHAAEAAEIYQRRLGGFGHLGLRAGEMSRGARVLSAFTEGGDPLRVTPALPAHVRARIAYDLGLFSGALGDLDRASRCYRAHNAVMGEAGSVRHLTTGLRTLAYTERLRGALDAALALVTTAADLAEDAGSVPDLVRADALSASILHDLGRIGEARRGFARARARGDDPFARRSLWEAEHALELGRFEAMRAETERNVEVCRELGWEGHVAHARTVLGLAALPADPEAARAHLTAARRWTAATGEVEVVLRCLDLEARVELAGRRLDAAGAAAREGRDLAEATGFALFHVRFLNHAVAVALARSPARALGAAREALAAAKARASWAWGLADALDQARAAAEAAGQKEEARAYAEEGRLVRAPLQDPGSG